MFETVTREQLARMMPAADPDELDRLLKLCQSPEGDRALREMLERNAGTNI